jgi:DNA-binding transcriptional LysR family regulator
MPSASSPKQGGSAGGRHVWRVGGSGGTCQHLLPPVLKEFLGLFPKVADCK